MWFLFLLENLGFMRVSGHNKQFTTPQLHHFTKSRFHEFYPTIFKESKGPIVCLLQVIGLFSVKYEKRIGPCSNEHDEYLR